MGHKVSLDIISDASDPTQVTTNYQALVNVKHVNLIFGPFSTLLTVPASKVTNRYGYAMIEGAGGGPSAFATGLRSLFDVSAPVANPLVPFASWIAALPKPERPKTAAYPTSNDPFTEPQLAVAEHILQKAGVKTVYFFRHVAARRTARGAPEPTVAGPSAAAGADRPRPTAAAAGGLVSSRPKVSG